jgi:hypothetical protein
MIFNKVKTRKQTTYTKHASPKGYYSKGRSGNRRHTHSTQVQRDIIVRDDPETEDIHTAHKYKGIL